MITTRGIDNDQEPKYLETRDLGTRCLGGLGTVTRDEDQVPVQGRVP